MNRLTPFLLCLLVGGLSSADTLASPRSFGGRAAMHAGGGHFSPRPIGFRGLPYGHHAGWNHWHGAGLRSWSFGFGYAPFYYGGYDGYVGGYVYPGYSRPAVAVETVQAAPAVQVAQWDDEGLREFALNKFCSTRGLDPDGNRVVVEIVALNYHDRTGALTKAKFKVRWVEWKIKRCKDGTEIREEKQKKTTIKLKFDELGRFKKYCD